MKEVKFSIKLEAGDSCVMLRQNKLVSGIVEEVRIISTREGIKVEYVVYIEEFKVTIKNAESGYWGPYTDKQDALSSIGGSVV